MKNFKKNEQLNENFSLDFDLEQIEETSKKKKKEVVERVRYPFFAVDNHKDGYLVLLVERGGKRNKNGKRFWCDHEKMFLQTKKPMTPITKEAAHALIEDFQNEDRRKRGWINNR